MPRKDSVNEFIVGADRFLYKLSWNGTNNTSDGELVELLMVDEEKMNNQFNDGKADSFGRLWIGKLGNYVHSLQLIVVLSLLLWHIKIKPIRGNYKAISFYRNGHF